MVSFVGMPCKLRKVIEKAASTKEFVNQLLHKDSFIASWLCFGKQPSIFSKLIKQLSLMYEIKFICIFFK